MYWLKELEKADLCQINKWRNNKKIIDQLCAPFRYINQEVDEKWFDQYMINRGNTIRCGIFQDDCETILGLASLTAIDPLNQSAEFHIMIGEQHQGKGAGSFAVKAMMEHGFYNLNLKRIELTVLEENIRAQHVYEKMGFVCEGLKRAAVYKNGEYKNVLMYSILFSEFEK